MKNSMEKIRIQISNLNLVECLREHVSPDRVTPTQTTLLTHVSRHVSMEDALRTSRS